ncbi:hypothetical protein H5410_004211 [Solanum commersonii]|uniref:Uncharacterized protein n=1 Tax=Solanum commersonii TaxID=4109 RepID=A0A9J6B710_SOLCO|nr:hypothetical protein H5410_004211 [Solanum commersonii]
MHYLTPTWHKFFLTYHSVSLVIFEAVPIVKLSLRNERWTSLFYVYWNVHLQFLELGFQVKKQTGWSYDYKQTLWKHLQKWLKKYYGGIKFLRCQMNLNPPR